MNSYRHEFESAPRVHDRQGSLTIMGSELDMTEGLNGMELIDMNDKG